MGRQTNTKWTDKELKDEDQNPQKPNYQEWTNEEWKRRLISENTEALDCLWELTLTWATATAKQQQALYGSDLEGKGIEEIGANKAYDYIMESGLMQFKGLCKFLSFCRMITHHRTLNEIRAWRRRHSGETSLDDEINDLNNSGQTDISGPLKDALEHLVLPYRRVIEWHYFEDVRYDEIADRLGINRNYVYLIADRAREKLYSYLKSQGYGSIEDILNVE